MTGELSIPPPRVLPVARRVFANPVDHVVWLAALTGDGEIVAELSGLGNRLARHAKFLVLNLIDESNGVEHEVSDGDQPSTERARRAHRLKEIFRKYPEAADFVLDAIVPFTLELYQRHAGPLTLDELALFGQELNYIAGRHGLQSSVSVPERRLRAGKRIERIQQTKGLWTGAAGAKAFWDVALDREVLEEALGLPASAETIGVVIGMLRRFTWMASYFAPWIIEGENRRSQLIAAADGEE